MTAKKRYNIGADTVRCRAAPASLMSWSTRWLWLMGTTLALSLVAVLVSSMVLKWIVMGALVSVSIGACFWIQHHIRRALKQHVMYYDRDPIGFNVSATMQAVQMVEDACARIAPLKDTVLAMSEVSQTLRDISDQTNLLALNAGIVAARAGEQERGFSIVAGKVHTLAERTNQSSVEISGTIEQFKNIALDALAAADNAHQTIEQIKTRLAAASKNDSASDAAV